jgi:hypothetical protein
MRKILLATFVSLTLAISAGSAAASSPTGIGSPDGSLACRQEDDAPLVTRIETINGKRTIVIDKEIVICGHPARPAVAYVTNPKTVDYAWTQLTEDLVVRIVDSVKQLGGTR